MNRNLANNPNHSSNNRIRNRYCLRRNRTRSSKIRNYNHQRSLYYWPGHNTEHNLNHSSSNCYCNYLVNNRKDQLDLHNLYHSNSILMNMNNTRPNRNYTPDMVNPARTAYMFRHLTYTSLRNQSSSGSPQGKSLQKPALAPDHSWTHHRSSYRANKGQSTESFPTRIVD